MANNVPKHTPGPWVWFEQKAETPEEAKAWLIDAVEQTAKNGRFTQNIQGVGAGDMESDHGWLIVCHTGCGPTSAANAQLIAAAADLLRATQKALPLLEDHLRTLIESHCLLDIGTRAPMRDTLDEDVKSDVEHLERCINDLRDALAKAEVRNA